MILISEVHSCFMQQMFVAKMEDCIESGDINVALGTDDDHAHGHAHNATRPEEEFSVADMIKTIGCVMEKGQLVAKMTKEQNQGSAYVNNENKESSKYD